MKVCIAGKNSIAVHGLKLALNRVGADNTIVCLNRTDDGRSGWQPSLRRYAREFNVPVVPLEFAQKQVDLIFLSLEFDQLLKPARFKSNRLFNMHFSLLPAYKGMYTSTWPILNGEAESGVTIHKIDRGIDTGNIISQESFQLEADETARSLYFKYLTIGGRLLDRTFDSLYKNDFEEREQSALGSSYYSRKSIDYSAISVDLNQTAVTIDRQVRAYSFREYQRPVVHGMPVAKTQILSDRSIKKPGRIISKDDNSMLIATIDFDIYLYRDSSLDLLDPTNNVKHSADLSRESASSHVN